MGEIDLPEYFSQLGADTHFIVPPGFPEALLPNHPPRFSIGHDLRVLPPKRRYIVFDANGGQLTRFLQRRFPDREVHDFLTSVVVHRVCHKQGVNNYLSCAPADENARPIVVLFTPRSGGTVLARLLNTSQVIQPPIVFREPLALCLLAGHPFQQIVRNAANAMRRPFNDVTLLVNTQFLRIDSNLGPMVGLMNWVLETNALVVSIRRSLHHQSASLSAALSTDIWEYWGDAPVVSQDFNLGLEGTRQQILEHMQFFEMIEDLLPPDNLLRVQYAALLQTPRRIVEEVATRTGRPMRFDISAAVEQLPTRLRTGLQIGDVSPCNLTNEKELEES
ncbi:hypothetical protein LA6_006171 (plasmid) [Marinibacterium anthonyi]|nr:hypothetical protein LA6_006171 [Marinibacterium anthonyi]